MGQASDQAEELSYLMCGMFTYDSLSVLWHMLSNNTVLFRVLENTFSNYYLIK